MLEINVWEIFTQICIIAVLYLVFRKFLYKPVGKFLKSRTEKFERMRADIEEDEKTLSAAKAEGERILSEAKAEAARILQAAADDSSRIRDEMTRQGRADAQAMKQEAIDAARKETEQSADKMRERVSAMALELAQSILKREINAEEHQELILRLLNKVG